MAPPADPGAEYAQIAYIKCERIYVLLCFTPFVRARPPDGGRAHRSPRDGSAQLDGVANQLGGNDEDNQADSGGYPYAE